MCVHLWLGLSDLPECSWSSCWNCGPWRHCHSWSDWEWTPPLQKLVTVQPCCDCGFQGFDAVGLLGWHHITHLCCCSPLPGSTAPVVGHIQHIAWERQHKSPQWSEYRFVSVWGVENGPAVWLSAVCSLLPKTISLTLAQSNKAFLIMVQMCL